MDEPDKQRRSQSLVESHNGIISIQVLNEFAYTLRKKFCLEYNVIDSAIRELSLNFTIVPQNIRTIFSALYIADRYGYSYYDSLIIAAARESECSILYTEDLQHGQIIENALTIINPFA